MTLKSCRWTLGVLAGLALAACSKDEPKKEQVASDKAPQREKKERKAPPSADSAERGPGERRHRPGPAALVEMFDADNSGSIEISELTAADSDKDGKLTLEELERLKPAMGKGARDPAAMITRLDANKDGKLQLGEVPERRREKLTAADANKDGALSTDELKAHFEARRSGGPSPSAR